MFFASAEIFHVERGSQNYKTSTANNLPHKTVCDYDQIDDTEYYWRQRRGSTVDYRLSIKSLVRFASFALLFLWCSNLVHAQASSSADASGKVCLDKDSGLDADSQTTARVDAGAPDALVDDAPDGADAGLMSLAPAVYSAEDARPQQFDPTAPISISPPGDELLEISPCSIPKCRR